MRLERWAPVGLILLLSCNYGLRGGGGFPADIETIYIEPFENQTTQFELGQQLFRELLERLPGELGVRPAGEEVAQAIVRGTITGYDDATEGYRQGDTGQSLDVVQRQVQVTITVQLIDVRRNVILWESSSLRGLGEYSPATQTDVDGRNKAIENLVDLIVDGAQSQW